MNTMIKIKTRLNKKGDKIISVYWFAILFIVAGAVVYMAIIFYGQPKNVREIEANVLINHIADCLAQGGYLKQGVLDEGFEENFLEECNLNFNVEDIYDWKKQEQYYLEAGIYEFDENTLDGLGDKIFDVAEGNENLKTMWQITGSSVSEKKTNKEYVIIHYTAGGGNIQNVFNSLKNKKWGVQYILDKDGKVGECRFGGLVSECVEKDVLEVTGQWENKNPGHVGCGSDRPECHSEDERPNPNDYEQDIDCCRPTVNDRAIGIEIINYGWLCGETDYEDFCGVGVEGKHVFRNEETGICEEQVRVWEKYTEEQIDALVELVFGIVSRNNIPIDREHIIGHDEVDTCRKQDPGPAFPWEEFMIRLKEKEKTIPGLTRSFYVLDENDNQYVIRISSIIGKVEKNAD